jgi:hypothetical protein
MRDNRSSVLVESRIMAEMLGLRTAMRRAILPALMAMAVLPAGATRHLTVEQLEKTLASSVAKHRADADMMKEFGDFDLTERLTDATRTRITTSLHLGPQTTLALQLLGRRVCGAGPAPRRAAQGRRSGCSRAKADHGDCWTLRDADVTPPARLSCHAHHLHLQRHGAGIQGE